MLTPPPETETIYVINNDYTESINRIQNESGMSALAWVFPNATQNYENINTQIYINDLDDFITEMNKYNIDTLYTDFQKILNVDGRNYYSEHLVGTPVTEVFYDFEGQQWEIDMFNYHYWFIKYDDDLKIDMCIIHERSMLSQETVIIEG